MPSFLRSVARSSSTLARPEPWPTSIRGRREKSGVRTSNGVRYERNGAIHKGARLSLHGPETVGNDGSHLFLHPHQMDRWDSCLSAEVVAEKCRVSDRECKQIFKCLQGIGLIRKIPKETNGTASYEPAIGKCQDTTQVKFALVHAIHRCTAFTGARGAPSRCTRCTFGGAYYAPQIHISNNIIQTEDYGFVKRTKHRLPDSEGTIEFDGHDTL